jgi:hypothetical protein
VSVKQTRLINVLYTAHNYDQFYWAHRVQQLGVGVSSSTRDDITVDCLVQALREAWQPEVKTRAREIASTALYAAGQLTPLRSARITPSHANADPARRATHHQ